MGKRENIAVLEAKLIVVGGDAKVTEIKLKLPSIIGRGNSATLTLPHPLVSRRHCEIFESDGKLMVRDLGSLNGTFVGSELITEAVLPPGELLTIGTVTFRAVYGDSEASTAAVPPSDATKKNPTTTTTHISPPTDARSAPVEFVEQVDEVVDVGDDIEFVDEVETVDAEEIIEIDDFEFVDADEPPASDAKDGDDDLTAFLDTIE